MEVHPGSSLFHLAFPSLSSLNTEKGSKEDEQTTSQGFPNPTPAPALWNWLRCSLHVLISILFYAFQPDPFSGRCRAENSRGTEEMQRQIWAKFARFRRNKFSQQNSTRISLLFTIEEQTNREIYLFRGEMMIPPFGYRFINKKFTTTNLIEKLLSRFFLSK